MQEKETPSHLLIITNGNYIVTATFENAYHNS